MKRFKNLLPTKKTTIVSSICLIALTGLLVGKANSETTEWTESQNLFLSYSVEQIELAPSFSERLFLDSFGKDEAAVAEALNSWKEIFTHTDSGGLSAKNPYCERFLDRDGSYGIYGKVVADYLKAKFMKSRTTPMLADDLVGMETSPTICPNWRMFDEAERIKFWVWTFAAISSIEASCGANPDAMSGVNGVPVYAGKDKAGHPIILRYKTAIGLLQMEKAKIDRSWRDLPTCNVADSAIGKSFENLRCGIDIMESLVSPNPPRRDAWPIYPGAGMESRSYWQELRAKNGGKIGELIRSYKPCRLKSPIFRIPSPIPIPSPIAVPRVSPFPPFPIPTLTSPRQR